MPKYDLLCSDCGWAQEMTLAASDVHSRACDRCGGLLRLIWLRSPAVGAPRYQMGAVLSDGQVVPGHFGKEAKRDPLKRK